jgi:hypothetical protein
MEDKPISSGEQENKKNCETTFCTTDGKQFEVTPEGSIGLLALGSVGLKAWRKVRREYYKNNPEESNEISAVEPEEKGEE